MVYPRFGHDAMLQTTPGDAQGHVFTDGVRRSAAFFKGLFGEVSAMQTLDCIPA